MRALYQVSDAMAYLVSRNVIHRDLALRFDVDMCVGSGGVTDGVQERSCWEGGHECGEAERCGAVAAAAGVGILSQIITRRQGWHDNVSI